MPKKLTPEQKEIVKQILEMKTPDVTMAMNRGFQYNIPEPKDEGEEE